MLRIKGKLNSLAGVSYIGLISCGSILLSLFTAFILMPSFTENQATAINNDSGFSTYSTTTTPSVSISLPDSIVFSEVVPTPDGSTTTASTSFSVATTESDGYSLYLYSDGDGSLKSSNPANISSIIATQGDVGLTLSSLKPNTWGYNLGTTAPDDNTTYIGVPTDSTTPIQTKDTSTTGQANDTYTLSFGAKVDSSIPSGAYSNTLTVAVVAQPQDVLFGGITKMQEMTAEICINATVGETKQLIDTRDGKSYWVEKLKDGNCWMTQNLDLDLDSNVQLTPDDSDVLANYTPITTTKGDPFSASGNAGYGQNSWDPGMYVKVDPDDYNSDCEQITSLSNCSGWQDVSNMVPITEVRTDNVVISDNTYDAHYLVGNYYQWEAATAGTGVSLTPTTQEVSGSICPKGWKLPAGRSSVGGSFYNLVNGLNSTTITQAPYYFLPSGRASSGLLWYANSSGTYWSSTAYYGYYSTEEAFALSFSQSSISPTNTFTRGSGQSVRCMVNGAVTINFDGNGADGVMARQYILPGNSQNLNNNTFTRSAYIFKGWNTAANGSGQSYSDGATYTVPTSPDNYSITLYAQWEEGYYIQDFSNALCQTLASSNNYTVVDKRDGNEYTVRYINGACWMTQNLRVAGGTTLTSETSNVAVNYTIPTTLLEGNGDSNIAGQIQDSGNTMYGYWYNFCAASAGTICSSSNTEDATSDICPSGWRLPTYDEQSGITNYLSAFSPVAGGRYSGGTLGVTGSGYWWSSTAEATAYQYILMYQSGSLSVYNSRNSLGRYVRCIRST